MCPELLVVVLFFLVGLVGHFACALFVRVLELPPLLLDSSTSVVCADTNTLLPFYWEQLVDYYGV